MPAIQHPAAQEELTHLTETQSIIQVERGVALQEQRNAEGELSYARMYDPDALPLREMLYTSAVQTVRNMDLARRKPYFTRINFTEENGEHRVYYIGKYGVLRTDSLEVAVVDWRAPVANLYYSGQIGPMHYVAPDGEVKGELTLKRQFGIEDGVLQTIFDTDLVSQDAYLQSVLGATTGDKLREIVTTIQAEQNFVIRHPLTRSLIVQGVAGSGKTTIALHRIAYLLYSFQETLRPEHMLIIAPNPLFLNFIAGVLPDLGVERVRQTTFSRLLAERFEGALPKCDAAAGVEEIVALSAEELGRRSRIAQIKGSLELEERINQYLDDYERRFSPEDGISYGPVQLFTHEELDQFLLVDEKPFPMMRRMAEFKKMLKGATKGASKTISRWMTEEYDRRIAKLNETVESLPERQARLNKLRESFEVQLKEVKAQVRPFIQKTLASFPTLDPTQLYIGFWQEMLEAEPEGSDLRVAAEYTCARFKRTRALEQEDLAAFALMAMRLIEIPKIDIRHVVVDEAQDFSPLEFMLLKRLCPGATMTVVGDLMQGVNAWRGLNAWSTVAEGIFEGKAVMHYLVTSYRNTIEIMNIAIRVARNRPTPGQQEAKPVLRHGEEPEFIAYKTAAEQAGRIAGLLRAWRAEGMTSVAVIEKSPKKLDALRRLLPAELNAHVLDVNAEEYETGVILAPASAVKGLEFDGVILADVSGDSFGDGELDARLLYVCLTRALHKMACLYEGELSPLLREDREDKDT